MIGILVWFNVPWIGFLGYPVKLGLLNLFYKMDQQGTPQTTSKQYRPGKYMISYKIVNGQVVKSQIYDRIAKKSISASEASANMG